MYAEYHKDLFTLTRRHKSHVGSRSSIGSMNGIYPREARDADFMCRRPRSADYSSIAPDLTNTIVTDFTDLMKQNVNSSSGHSSVTSESSGNITGNGELDPVGDGEEDGMDGRSLSESDGGGYDFSKFDALYQEHVSEMLEIRSLNNKRAELTEQMSENSMEKDRTYSCGEYNYHRCIYNDISSILKVYLEYVTETGIS